MSFLGKKWVIRNQKTDLNLIDKMLENRDLKTDEERYSFFDYSLKKLHDPFLMKDMKKAVDRLKKAVEKQEKIMIFGDYDVDGISATAVLYDLLSKIGADIHYTLPNREHDGYGLKDYFMQRFSDEGVKLVITVDCGTSNIKEISLANELGMEVIVTDHHSIPSELPKPIALINPKQTDCKYPNKELSGSGVAYKLTCALAPFYFDEETTKKYLLEQMGIAVLGLIADCMHLTGENRVLTRNGLKILEQGNHAGIKALLDEANMPSDKITSGTVGFFIGPRINAAGRLDDAEHALKLLLGDTKKAQTLSKLNVRRRELVDQFVDEAVIQIRAMDELPRIIIVSSKEWNAGTLGLIASKMCDIFHRPTIAMQEKENEYVASCRSLNEFNITAFLRNEAGNLFITIGGHMLAGGFTLPKKNKHALQTIIDEKAAGYIDLDDFYGILNVECEVNLEELSFDMTDRITKFQPFGYGNPEPTLMLKNVQIPSAKQVGQKKEHLQLAVQLGDKKLQAIAFRFGEHLDKIKPENNYDIAFNLEINEWQGHKKLQLRIVDLKQAD